MSTRDSCKSCPRSRISEILGFLHFLLVAKKTHMAQVIGGNTGQYHLARFEMAQISRKSVKSAENEKLPTQLLVTHARTHLINMTKLHFGQHTGTRTNLAILMHVGVDPDDKVLANQHLHYTYMRTAALLGHQVALIAVVHLPCTYIPFPALAIFVAATQVPTRKIYHNLALACVADCHIFNQRAALECSVESVSYCRTLACGS